MTWRDDIRNRIEAVVDRTQGRPYAERVAEIDKARYVECRGFAYRVWREERARALMYLPKGTT